MAKYKIYTDGSARGDKVSYGGWAAIIEKDDQIIDILKGNKHPSTNNEMELTAIKNAILYIEKIQKSLFGDSFVIYTDSNYSLQSVTNWYKQWRVNGWKNSKKELVKNKELIQEIIDLLERNTYISIEKVKGHNGNIGNEMADDYAVDEAIKIQSEILKEGVDLWQK